MPASESAELPLPSLLPTPRHVRRTSGDAACPAMLRERLSSAMRDGGMRSLQGLVRSETDATLASKPDAYRLRIVRGLNDMAEISLTSVTLEGDRAGLATLAQVLAQYPGRLPCIEIEDWSTFQTRGVMLDVSRDRVPTMAHLKSIIDLLASLKFNHLQLYTEHTFAYRGYERVWSGASPITPDEARELAAYCRDRGVELSANQNCFGHLAKWLKMPEYRHLAEIERDEQEWRFMHFPRFGPFSLCPTEPQAVEFVHDLLSQLVPCFESTRVNIGCDETFDVGWGRSRSTAEELVASGATPEQARAELFFNFVREVCGALGSVENARGERCTPMMWGDIALHHADLLHMLPQSVIGLAWEYEPTDKFGSWCRVLREHGHEAWVCPGTSSWRSFTGRTRERRANIADAAEQGAASGATGFLVCDWGDVGHRQHWPISLMPLAQAAEAAWNPAGARAFDPHNASRVIFKDDGSLGGWLEALGDVDEKVRAAAKLRNATALFNDLHCPLAKQPAERPIKPDVPLSLWVDAQQLLLRVASSQPPIRDDLIRREIDHTVNRAKLALAHAVSAREGATAQQTQALADMARDVIVDHEALWPMRSRPGGLADSVAHDHAILRGILDARQATPGRT